MPLIVLILNILGLALIIHYSGLYELSRNVVILSVITYYLVSYKNYRDIFHPSIVPLIAGILYFIGSNNTDYISTENEHTYGLVVIFGLFGLYLGIFFGMKWRGGSTTVSVPFPGSTLLLSLLLLSWIVGFAGFVGIVKQIGIPLLAENLNDHRIEIQNEIQYFGLLMLMYKFFIIHIYLASITIFLEKRYFIRIISVLGVFLAFIALMMFGNRGLVVFPLFTLFVLYHYFTGGVQLFKSVLVGVFFISIIGLAGYYRSSSGVDVTMDNIALRAFHELSIPSNNLTIIVSLFPSAHEYLYGNGFLSALATLLPVKQYL